MEKSTVYFTDFRCPVGTSQLDKLKKLCIAAGIKDIVYWKGKFVAIKMHFGELETWRFFVRIMRKWLQISVKSREAFRF